jgi:3',5'-cyclic-nucleotide phosphodiesterase
LMQSSLEDPSCITAEEDKLLLWRIVMKCADLGHCAKPTDLHKKWAYRVMEEMYRQGEAESSMGFPVSAAMDRSKLGSAATSQASFLEYVCLPLFVAWKDYSGEDLLVTSIETNIRFWKAMADQGGWDCSPLLIVLCLHLFLCGWGRY